MKKKIGVVLEATLGGTRKHVFDLLNRLSYEKYELYYFYSERRADLNFKREVDLLKLKGVKLYKLPMTASVFTIKNFWSIILLHYFIRKENIQVLHLHGAIAGGIGRLAAIFANKVKFIIYTTHGGVLHKINRRSGKLYYFIEKLLTSKKLIYIAVSNEEREELSRKINTENIQVIRNGIEIEDKILDSENIAIKKKEISQKIGLELHNKFIILYPAVFLEAKGHIHFFEALKKSKVSLAQEIIFILAGDGPLLSKTKKLVHNIDYLKNRVFFIGFTTELTHYYNICDLVILPSRAEAFGYVIIEAFLHKKPVFATKVGGTNDLIIDGFDGFFFELGKIEYFIQLVNSYKDNNYKLKILGQNGYNKVLSDFNISTMIQRLECIYDL